jgi:2,3-bisphosphoglycerate-dependent phosphoglycerate mutase
MVEKAPEVQSEPGGVLVLVRHGQTEWNASGRFSGWADVSLNDRGRREAKAMGELLAEHDFYPADAYSSRLGRARETLDVVLECLGGGARDRPALARHAPAWELNERHYGALTALVKRQAADQFGAEQVKNWRRGFAVRPPEMHESHPWHELIYDGGTYDDVDDGVVLPTGESLEDCEKRCVAYVSARVLPRVAAGRHGLVSAHNNTIRCLLHALCRESEEVMTRFEMPTGGAIVLKIGGDGTVVGRQDLTPPRPQIKRRRRVRAAAPVQVGRVVGVPDVDDGRVGLFDLLGPVVLLPDEAHPARRVGVLGLAVQEVGRLAHARDPGQRVARDDDRDAVRVRGAALL